MCFMCTYVSMKCTEEIALFIINSIYRGRSRNSVDGGGGGLSYGAIFSIIDGTNCSPKAVLACMSVNLFVSFSVQ